MTLGWRDADLCFGTGVISSMVNSVVVLCFLSSLLGTLACAETQAATCAICDARVEGRLFAGGLVQ